MSEPENQRTGRSFQTNHFVLTFFNQTEINPLSRDTTVSPIVFFIKSPYNAAQKTRLFVDSQLGK